MILIVTFVMTIFCFFMFWITPGIPGRIYILGYLGLIASFSISLFIYIIFYWGPEQEKLKSKNEKK